MTREQEYADFFLATWPDLTAFATTLCRGDRTVGEEVAQEALARVYVRFGRLAEPRPYAFKVATNLVRSRWQADDRATPTDPARLPERVVVPVHDCTIDAVQALPPRLRDAVLLHYYADLPVEAVAKVLRRPTGTVKQRLHEARGVLALSLREETP